jgi:hypothetical protein
MGSTAAKLLALRQLRRERGDWRCAVRLLQGQAKLLGARAGALPRAAAAQILQWRRQARRRGRALRNPIPPRALALLRAEYRRRLGDGLAQRAAWNLALEAGRRRGWI